MDKKGYPPTKCKFCGAQSWFETLVVNCNRQYQYMYRCERCKKRTIIMGPTYEEVLHLPNKKEVLKEYARKKTCNV